MGLIKAKGQQAVESAASSSVDLSAVMIRLKDGDSIRVRLLTSEDYVEYEAIGDFQLGVFTQPTREDKDYFVEAGKLAKAKAANVDEKFEGLYPKKRYLVAFVDLKESIVRYWDASKTQFNSFVSQIEDYKEMIDDKEEAVFTFKRTGNKTETSYTLQYVPKPKKDELETFHEFDGTVVDIPDFESVLRPRSAELQVGVLKEAGFPVEEYFPEVKLEDKEDSAEEDAVSELDNI